MVNEPDAAGAEGNDEDRGPDQTPEQEEVLAAIRASNDKNTEQAEAELAAVLPRLIFVLATGPKSEEDGTLLVRAATVTAARIVRAIQLKGAAKKAPAVDPVAELVECLKDLLPHARSDVERLNAQMVGNLYPAINLSRLERAENLLALYGKGK